MILNLVTGLGILFAVMGLGILINNKWFTKMYNEFDKGVYLWYIGAFITLAFGLVVTALNVPIDWKTWIVEILGWMGILKGASLFIIPSPTIKLTKIMPKRGMLVFAGIFCLLLGLILLLC